MSIAEAKSLIHKLVVETDDIDILNQVADLFNILKTKNTDWWDTISDEQKKLIEVGIQQMKNGEGIPHQEARKEIDQLLKNKQQP